MWLRAYAASALVLACMSGGTCLGQVEQKENYRLTPNDVLYFSVLGEPDTVAEVRVAGDGTGNFPFLKPFRVGGLTVAEATEALRQAYIQQEYFVNPQINLGVRIYAKRVFTVLGQVQRPGTYELVGNESISLLGAIGMAGGFTPYANRSAVMLRRVQNGQEQRARLDGRENERGPYGPNFQVCAGDVITVGQSLF